jgi:DoxX-like family
MSALAVKVHETTLFKRSLPWIGWLLSLGSVWILLMSARWKLTFDPWYVKEWMRIGWDPDVLPRIAIVQLTCVVLYLTPPTAVLGVVLLTGYLGGAISQYARLGEPYPILVPLTTALVAWAGLYLREERLRSLLPLRGKPRSS